METKCRSRIRFIAAGAAVAGLALGASAYAEDITVTTFGGVWQEAVTECFAKEYERQTGDKANVLIGSPIQWISQIEASPEDPPIDVLVTTEFTTLIAGDKGLIERPTLEDIPHLADAAPIFKRGVENWGSCFNYAAFVIVYNKNTVKDPPESQKEFIERTIAGDWIATLPTINYQATPAAVIWNFADLYGGGIDNIQPAIDKVKAMKDSGNLIGWNSVTEFLNQMQTGEADIGMYWDGRAFAFIDQGNDWIGVISPSDKASIGCGAMNKVTNAPDSAWDYLNIVYSPEGGKCFAERLQYGVANQKVQYSEKLQNRITPYENTRIAPSRATGEKTAEWIERWNKEVGF